MRSTGQRDASEPREASLARWLTTPALGSFRSHWVERVIPGSLLTAWLPSKFRPRKAGTRRPGATSLGKYSKRLIRGPAGLAVKRIATSRRIALPPSASLSSELTVKTGLMGLGGVG